MSGTDEFFDSFYKSSRINVVKMFLDEGRRELLNNNGYQYEIIESDTPYVVANRNYNSLKKFADNTIFLEQYFESLEVIEQDGVVAIETKDFIPISPDSIERYGIKTTTIKIKSSYEVMEHNATSYDKKTNTYTWYIHDYTESFSLLFSMAIHEL